MSAEGIADPIVDGMGFYLRKRIFEETGDLDLSDLPPSLFSPVSKIAAVMIFELEEIVSKVVEARGR